MNCQHKRFKEFVEKQKWINAKTYEAFAPHEYILRKNMRGKDYFTFLDFAIYINEKGYTKLFMGKRYTCYDIGNYRYWTMDKVIKETNLINRVLNKMVNQK